MSGAGGRPLGDRPTRGPSVSEAFSADVVDPALDRLALLLPPGGLFLGPHLAPHGEKIGAARAIKLTFDTFLISEGRQYAQPPWIDLCVKMWREQGLELDWAEIESREAMQAIMTRKMPTQHTQVPAELVPKVFGQWYEWFKAIARYNYARNAAHLPDRPYIDEVIKAIGGRYDESSFTEEERCGMRDIFEEMRHRDPTASMTADDAAVEFVLAATFKSDGHWMLNDLRPRPGTFLPDQHGSMLRHATHTSLSRETAGRRLSDLQAACVRVSAVITALQETQPKHPALELYQPLIDRHNARHPRAQVTSLHLWHARSHGG